MRPEFINRVDEIITFNSLTREDFAKIAGLMLGQLRDALAAKEITLTYTEAATKLIAEQSYSVKFGARNMRRFIQTHVEDALAEKIIAGYNARVRIAKLDAAGGQLSIECI